MSNIVAIVGRPNVGKSTFFNRLIQRREAIVDSVSGVTRDRHYGKSDWNGKEFTVIDTGGYVIGSEDVFEAENAPLKGRPMYPPIDVTLIIVPDCCFRM